MKLSFIIPAHNEQDYLEPTLRSIHAAAGQVGQLYEIIVVDDDSTDGTARVAQPLADRVLRVKLRQIAAVRNAGAKAARGDLLCFLDADTSLSHATLNAAWKASCSGSVGGGAPVRIDDAIPLSATFAVQLWNVISRTFRWAAGCFLFARREAFEQVGGFDERFYAAEEIILSMALHRCGPFTIVRPPVVTSPRKLHSHPVTEHFKLMVKTLATGGRAIQRREGLDIWYRSGRGDESRPTGTVDG